MAGRKDQLYLQTLVDSERPARMVGLFTGHALKPKDFGRLVDACVNSSAGMKRRPGSAVCHGGANVARLSAVATTSATIQGHDSSRTSAQASP